MSEENRNDKDAPPIEQVLDGLKEIDRLRSDFSAYHKSASEEIAALKAKNERLKAGIAQEKDMRMMLCHQAAQYGTLVLERDASILALKAELAEERSGRPMLAKATDQCRELELQVADLKRQASELEERALKSQSVTSMTVVELEKELAGERAYSASLFMENIDLETKISDFTAQVAALTPPDWIPQYPPVEFLQDEFACYVGFIEEDSKCIRLLTNTRPLCGHYHHWPKTENYPILNRWRLGCPAPKEETT